MDFVDVSQELPLIYASNDKIKNEFFLNQGNRF
jgi:hypothetical protein